MIPDEAVEAAWDAFDETDDPIAALRAAAPHLTPNMEWGIFRPTDGPDATPTENRRYGSREVAQRQLERDYRQPEFWEVRGRPVGRWTK